MSALHRAWRNEVADRAVVEVDQVASVKSAPAPAMLAAAERLRQSINQRRAERQEAT